MLRPTEFQLRARSDMNDEASARYISHQTGDDRMSDIVSDAMEQLRLDNDTAIVSDDLQPFTGDMPAESLRAPPPSPINATCGSLRDHNMEFDFIRDVQSDQEKSRAVDTVANKALSTDTRYHELHNASRSRHIKTKSMCELRQKRRSTVVRDNPTLSQGSTGDGNSAHAGLHGANLCCRPQRFGLTKQTAAAYRNSAQSEGSLLAPVEISPIDASASLQRSVYGPLPPALDLPPPAIPSPRFSSTLMLPNSMHTTDIAPHSSGLHVSVPAATTFNATSSQLILTSLERRRALAARFQRRAHRRQKRADMDDLSQQISRVGMRST